MKTRSLEKVIRQVQKFGQSAANSRVEEIMTLWEAV
jgi:hypothetical protein